MDNVASVIGYIAYEKKLLCHYFFKIQFKSIGKALHSLLIRIALSALRSHNILSNVYLKVLLTFHYLWEKNKNFMLQLRRIYVFVSS